MAPEVIKTWEDEVAKQIAKNLQEEIDWKVMMSLLGYIHISMSWPESMNEVQAHGISEWCKKTLKEDHHGRGKDWYFKSERDASMFVLRWA